MSTDSYTLGIDIGGTKCAVILGCGEIPQCTNGVILDKLSFPTLPCRGYRTVIEDIVSNAEKILSRNAIKSQSLLSIGISCGGPLDSKTGTVKCPPNLPDWDDVPVAEIVGSRIGAPAFLQNDANACAIAEWKFGAGKGLDNLIFLTFGTGMGAGLILDGKLYSGTNDMAGEIGHIRLCEDGGPVGYGKRGSFEGFCSGGGIARLAKEYFEKTGTVFDGEITAKNVALEAERGNEQAREVYRICARRLGQGLSMLVDILNPQAIIIGSIYERSGKLLESEMRRVLEQEALPLSLSVCKILPAALGDSIGDYAALGVAFAAIQ